MARGGTGGMLGVGGTRSNISRKALRGGNRDTRIGGARDPQAHKVTGAPRTGPTRPPGAIRRPTPRPSPLCTGHRAAS
ncbi:DUF6243 family protein [Streptomyces doebereineriae]|uniref:DUF6243 family protein n=1 Tax=Streptomyces doebereineriae TaxID=3075528 RepID=A0ABU2V615_9ACTN|nr:DUF6243 family protein [Streptomyces sp. DSM 41640]MDT0480992.1 DUF6243 family protein [Streptomyces sp. DSM 41640]